MQLDLGGLECFRCIPKKSRKALSDAESVKELRLGSDLYQRWPHVCRECLQGYRSAEELHVGWRGFRDCHRCENQCLTYEHLRMHNYKKFLSLGLLPLGLRLLLASGLQAGLLST